MTIKQIITANRNLHSSVFALLRAAEERLERMRHHRHPERDIVAQTAKVDALKAERLRLRLRIKELRAAA